MMSKSAESCETCGRYDGSCSDCGGCVQYSRWIPKSETEKERVDRRIKTILAPGAGCRDDCYREPETDKDPKARYYDAGGLETLDIIKAKLTPDQYKGWLLGNLLKYSCRANFKDQMARDIEKVAFYSAEMFKILEA